MNGPSDEVKDEMKVGPKNEIDHELRQALRTCAFCPNICRPHAPTDGPAWPESHTASALSLVALALMEGRLPDDTDTRALLGQRRVLQATQPHCLYQLDVSARLDQALAQAAGSRP